MKLGRIKNKLRMMMALSLFVSACSRPVEMPIPDNSLQFNDSTKDIEFLVRPNELIPVSSPSGDVFTSELFRHIYNMQTLGELTKKATWATDSQEQFLKYYRTENNFSKVQFGSSPYADFMIANSKAQFLEATEKLDETFAEEINKITQITEEMKATYPFPTKAITVSQALTSIVMVINVFETRLQKSDVLPALKQGILAGIYNQFWLKLPATQQILAQFEQSPDFATSIAVLRGLFTTLDIEMTQDVEGKLQSASEIASLLNKENLNAKDAFIILVELWDRMEPEDRKSTFGEMSPELYDFLNSKNRKERECLKQKDCNDLLLDIAKRFFILPEIKKYGVDKLQKEILESAKASLIEETGQAATDLVKDLPNILMKSISDEMQKVLVQLQSVREDYDGFVRKEIQNWFEKKFARSELPALEGRMVQIKNVKTEIEFSGKYTDSTEVSADALGNALLASQQLFKMPRAKSLQKDISEAQILSLVRINQMLAHGGFSTADGGSFSALSRGFNLKELVPMNIQLGLQLPFLFSMPSPVRIEKGFEIPKDVIPANFMIASQARLLNGFTRMTEVFKDWSKAPLDDLLGNIEAGEMIESLPAEDLAVPAFPKDAFLAVALGNASSVLANLKAKGTPLFVVCTNGEFAWADEEKTCDTPSAFAALVSVKERVRQEEIKISEMALFLEALVQYIQTGTDIIEKTKSQHLLKPGADSKSAIDSLKESLPDLRNLAMGLTNFIVTRMQQNDGRFLSKINVVDVAKSPNSGFVGVLSNLEEQLAGLNAVIKSANFFRLPPYQRAVVRGYHALNQNFFNEKKQFYNENDLNSKQDVRDQTISTIRVAQAMNVLPLVIPFLTDEKSVAQLKDLLYLWGYSIKGKSL